MKYISEEFVNDEDMASAEGQGFALNIVFCRDCVNHHTINCPMYYEETEPFLGQTYVITDSPDNGFCHLGAPKE